ncbi:hypothetical protein KTQ42_05770|uniref:hypothetical protein n=1 Tax=Noviherbaspirillum sp. L7-7A TaxID=2850560 RepID=UPI001C2BD37C|nr:hypothetical protein [Noviherbaspirillum sp. L7-7A]MBV0878813.1 hypothetical protein [Noviherbaspirillum sp. L7-7A]
MPHAQTGKLNHYALRVEGRAWLDDLTIEQIWAILHAAFQQLEPRQELMFMILMPNGATPCRCLPRSVFESSLPDPAMLLKALTSPLPTPADDGFYFRVANGSANWDSASLS